MDFGTRRPVAWRLAAVLALTAGLLAPVVTAREAAAQTALPATAAAAPETTTLYYEIDLDFAGSQWQHVEALLARVGVPDALDLGRESILEESEDSGDFTEADLDALLGGEMALMVSSDTIQTVIEQFGQMGRRHRGMDADATPVAASPGGAFGVAVVLQPGDVDAAWAYVERQMQGLAAEVNTTVADSAYGDAQILWVEFDEAMMKEHRRIIDEAMEDFAAGGMHDMSGMGGMHDVRGFAAGQAGDFIIAAASQADVEEIVDTISGDTPSLADSATVQQVRDELPGEALSFLYVDDSSILAAMDPETIAAYKELDPDMPDPVATASGMTVSADEPGFRVDLVSIPLGGATLPQTAMMDDAAITEAAESVPGNSWIYGAARIDSSSWIGAAFAVAQAVNAESHGKRDKARMQNFMPTAEEIKEAFAQAKEVLGFDPWEDLFAHLGEQVTAYATFPAISGEGFDMDALLSIATSDPEALAPTVEKIAAWIQKEDTGADVSTREVGEDTVHVITSADMDMAPPFEFGVVGDQLAAGIGAGIDNLGTAPSSSLADDEQYQTVLSLLPSEFYFIEYFDMRPVTGFFAMMEGSMSMADADPACREFASQELAQAAYDEDPLANSDLDTDFDGEACEDAFGATATPVAVTGSVENMKAFAMVAFNDGTRMGSSMILYIPEPES